MSLLERLLASTPASAEDGRTALQRIGLPGPRTESWRYSSMRALEGLDPGAPPLDPGAHAVLAGLSGDLARVDAHGLDIANALPAGLSVAPVGAAGPASQPDLAFRVLNEAGPVLGAAVEVHAPVAGVWRLGTQHASLGFAQFRHQLRLHPGAELTLVEHLYGVDASSGLSNTLVEVEIAAGARLRWIRLQELGSKAHAVQRTELRVAGDGQLQYVACELGALWSRHELAIDLLGASAQAEIHGLVAMRARQHHDTQLAIHHRSAAAITRTLWKAVADQRARSVFNGLIAVSPGADQTEAHLKTANLLLSAHAEIDTKPELVIEADEVVCSHGATVGQLDERALFYLRSRGIPEVQARQILTLAFGGEVLAAIADAALRAAVAERVDAHLPQASA